MHKASRAPSLTSLSDLPLSPNSLSSSLRAQESTSCALQGVREAGAEQKAAQTPSTGHRVYYKVPASLDAPPPPAPQLFLADLVCTLHGP